MKIFFSWSWFTWISFLERFRIKWWLAKSAFELWGLKNVGAPSTVVTSGLVKPPLSNSWAEILRTGVPEPELFFDPALPATTAGQLMVRLLGWPLEYAESADAPLLLTQRPYLSRQSVSIFLLSKILNPDSPFWFFLRSRWPTKQT